MTLSASVFLLPCSLQQCTVPGWSLVTNHRSGPDREVWGCWIQGLSSHFLRTQILTRPYTRLDILDFSVVSSSRNPTQWPLVARSFPHPGSFLDKKLLSTLFLFHLDIQENFLVHYMTWDSSSTWEWYFSLYVSVSPPFPRNLVMVLSITLILKFPF